MLQLSYSVPSLKQIHFCSLARGEVVSWQISLGSQEHISSEERQCDCVCVWTASVWGICTSECQHSWQYNCSRSAVTYTSSKFRLHIYYSPVLLHKESSAHSFQRWTPRTWNYKYPGNLWKIKRDILGYVEGMNAYTYSPRGTESL